MYFIFSSGKQPQDNVWKVWKALSKMEHETRLDIKQDFLSSSQSLLCCSLPFFNEGKSHSDYLPLQQHPCCNHDVLQACSSLVFDIWATASFCLKSDCWSYSDLMINILCFPASEGGKKKTTSFTGTQEDT